MKKQNKTELLKLDIEFLKSENKRHRDLINLQRKQLKDMESLCLWSARRLEPINRSYVLRALKTNKEMVIE